MRKEKAAQPPLEAAMPTEKFGEKTLTDALRGLAQEPLHRGLHVPVRLRKRRAGLLLVKAHLHHLAAASPKFSL